MKKYEALLIDLDDTLIDNKKAMEYALHCVMKELNIKPTKELDAAWHIFDRKHWDLWEKRLMEIPERAKTDIDFRITYLRSMRFVNFFKNYNVSFEKAIHLNDIFVSNLATDIEPIEHSKEFIEDAVNKGYKIFITTNGPIIPANTKVEKADLSRYIEHIFCSEDIGYSKPFTEFFDYVFSKINIPREKTIIIGDSLSTDIVSGMKNGFDSAWYNPNNQPLPDEYQPTIIFNDFKELKRKLNEK